MNDEVRQMRDEYADDMLEVVEARTWLADFMKEVNSQDNRATATPYYYELRGTDDDGQVDRDKA